jgi:hypothetical protein
VPIGVAPGVFSNQNALMGRLFQIDAREMPPFGSSRGEIRE